MMCVMQRTLVVLGFVLAGCGSSSATSGATDGGADAGSGDITREVPGFDHRAYILHVPGGVVPATPTPVVLVLHGGGGNAEGANAITCPGGDVTSSDCITGVGDREGFAVVFPNGTPAGVLDLRTWNAGGGADNWQCVSGVACKQGVDDIAYFKALLGDLATVMPVDDKRVFATGLSNGAAMDHRLACAMADRIAAIAPIGGGNQLATSAPCAPSRAVSDLEIHGTEDPCWAYDGGPAACAQKDGKEKIDVATTVSGWVARDGCPATPAITELPDTDPGDGTTTRSEAYAPCDAGSAVELLRIEGGGHTWPGGSQYLSEANVGRVSRDFSASERMWTFFAAHAMP